ncbi:hypothetical protein ABI59_02175 [Acidobacteria bacterium Mor1]|nr:hypothetical protein ABI59_02175 [Acidobacteria bacterium Mor1]
MQRTRHTRARALAAPHPVRRLLAATPWLAAIWFTIVAGLATDAFGLTSVYMPPEALASRATLIVEGTPTAVESAMDPETGRIATYVTLSIEIVHRGPSDLSEVVLRESGGRFGTVEHVVEGSPVYRSGERVFAFLEPADDGALRTVGAFQGNFHQRLDDHGHRVGERIMAGHMIGAVPQPFHGRHDHGDGSVDRISWNDLISVSAGVPGPGIDRLRPIPLGHGSVDRAPTHRWERRPPEHPRLVRDTLASTVREGEVQAAFTPLGSPSRWYASDSGTAVQFNIDPSGNPLGNAAAAVAEIQRGMDAWNDVPEARVLLAPGNTAYDYRTNFAQGPTQSYSGVNIVLFDDPYGEVPDPSGCSGTIAWGGYYRSTVPQSTVNGAEFYPILTGYVIFNNSFECLLANPDNLAEVATHELGHALGFGHSTTPDAIMRASFYGNRGPRLGDDDRDIAHCFYPHTLSLTSPTGNDIETGTAVAIQWTSSSESSGDDGHVDLELSTDGGTNWTTIRSGEPNDGHYGWLTPGTGASDVLVRVVRHNLIQPTPDPFPTACSGSVSASFDLIQPPAPVAGSVPAGTVLVDKDPSGALRIDWGASGSGDAVDYAIYEGSLDTLRSGSFDHGPADCSAGADLTELVWPQSGDRFFLVAPMTADYEGHYGYSTSGAIRPSSAPSACKVRESI